MLTNNLNSNLIVEVLKKWQTEKIFGCHNPWEIPLVNALSKNSKIEYVESFQNNLTIPLAEGYAKQSGKIGVAIFGDQNNLINSLGFIKSAKINQSPLLIISGIKENRAHEHYNSNILLNKFCKNNYKVHKSNETFKVFQKAIKEAITEPFGPVVVELTEELLNAKVEKNDFALEKTQSYKICSPLDNVEKIALALLKSKSPVFITGFQLAQTNSQNELGELAEILGSPVICENQSNSSVHSVNLPYYHPYNLGFYNQKDPAMSSYLKNTDCVLTIGCQDDEQILQEVKNTTLIIQAVNKEKLLNKSKPANYALIGDLKINLTNLLEMIKKYQWPYEKQLEKRKKINRNIIQKSLIERQKLLDKVSFSDKNIKPLHIIKAFNDVFGKDTIFIDQSQSFSNFIKKYFHFSASNEIFGNLVDIPGWSLPFSAGVSIANTQKKRVVCLISDSQFLETANTILTLVKNKIPLTVVIFNNKGKMQLNFKNSHFKFGGNKTNFNFPKELNFENYVLGFGVKIISVNKASELISLISKNNNSKGPTIFEINTTDDPSSWNC